MRFAAAFVFGRNSISIVRYSCTVIALLTCRMGNCECRPEIRRRAGGPS
jgi:hypothetical protein